MHLGKIGIILVSLLTLALSVHAAPSKKHESTPTCASSLINESVIQAVRAMRRHKALTKAFNELIKLFPADLTGEERSAILSLADFDQTSIVFLNKVCTRYKGAERLNYLNLMLEKSVFGRVIPPFAKYIDNDTDYGLRLLQQDDPIIDELIIEALDERTFN